MIDMSKVEKGHNAGLDEVEKGISKGTDTQLKGLSEEDLGPPPTPTPTTYPAAAMDTLTGRKGGEKTKKHAKKSTEPKSKDNPLGLDAKTLKLIGSTPQRPNNHVKVVI